MTDTGLNRRERVRLQTLNEINRHATAQVAAGGVAALSLNAIAKTMGMSGPAIYRYYASREELLAALVTEGYGELGRVVEAASESGRRLPSDRRLHKVADAYRAWAISNPYRYELLFSVRPAGYEDPNEAISAIQPAMRVLLELLGAIAADAGAASDGPAGRLGSQLAAWSKARSAESVEAEVSTRVLLLGVVTWTRLHGVVTLQLAGVIGDMGIDAALLVDAEIDAIVAAARSTGRT